MIMTALDLVKAFDTVGHAIIMKNILELTLPNELRRWFVNYFSRRQAYVEFQGY